MSRKQWKFATGIVVVTAAILVLVGVSIQGNMAYYIDVSDYLTKGPGSLGANYRVKGNVVAGTIEKDPGKLGALFEMSDGNRAMRVRYEKELPDTFTDEAEVVVEGVMGPDGVFEAHTLLAKCPSKYETEVELEPSA